MKILGVHVGHDSNISVIENGELIYYGKEESYSNIKKDLSPDYIFDVVKQEYTVDAVAYAVPTSNDQKTEHFETYCRKFFNNNFVNLSERHHLCHASHAFYDSGFDESYNVVIDANGSLFYDHEQFLLRGREHESIYEASYPCNFKVIKQNDPAWYGITLVYALITELIGGTQLDNGKTMGLSAYGDIDKDLPPFFDGIYPAGRLHGSLPISPGNYFYFHENKNIIDNPFVKQFEFVKFHQEMYHDVRFIFLNILKNITKLKNTYELTKSNYKEYADLAAKIQKESEDAIINFILENCDFKACKNITLSGGYGLNCLNNYRLLHELPEDVNLFVQPNADDSGISIGAAKYLYYKLSNSKEKFPLTDIYKSGNKEIDYWNLQHYVEASVS